MEIEQDHPRKSAGRFIEEISRMAHAYFQTEFKPYAIGHAQIMTLLYVARNEDISQHALAKYFKLDKSSITSQMSILERNGYIQRKVSGKDARRHEIRVTEKTKKILGSLIAIYFSWTETLLVGFDEKERNEMFSYLERMRDNAKEKIDSLKERVKEL